MEISVILPIHKINKETKALLENAIKSISRQQYKPTELLLVAANDKKLLKELETLDLGDIKDITKIVKNDGDTSFASQMNLGVKEASNEWVSFIELDDEFSSIWFKNVNIYSNAYDDVELFLPMIVNVDEDKRFIGFTNEAVWAAEFSDELGFLDNNALNNYQNFNFDGMVIKKEVYQELGGIKESIKLTFMYEFLLRLTYNDVKVMTIPKLGYKHVNGRKDSLFDEYKNNLSDDERRWWLSTAKKESFFNYDREITYEKID